MPHRQLNAPYQGARYEYLVTFALSAVASVVPVPRPEDFGFDHLCTLTELVDGLRYPRTSFGLQVKPKSDPILKRGGHSKDGRWQRWEIEWLFNRDIPLILAIVDPNKWHIELYSTWNVWHPYWMSKMPFEVWLRPEEVPPREREPKVPRRREDQEAKLGEGDRQHWDVYLGPPILIINPFQPKDPENIIRECLRKWIDIDMLNLLYRKLGVPWMYSVPQWETAQPPAVGAEHWVFWGKSKSPAREPVQPRELLRTIAPMILALAKNYEEQGASDDLERLKGIASILDAEGLIPKELRNLFKNDLQ